MTDTCKQCNEPYRKIRFNQHFCREECRRLYWKAKPSKEARKVVDASEAALERAKGTATCQHCSSIYQPFQRFCCDDCRRQYWKARNAKTVTEPIVAEPVMIEPTLLEPIVATCHQCNAPYQAKLGKRFCSDQCRRRFWRATHPTEPTLAEPTVAEPTVAEPVVADLAQTACQHCGNLYQTGPKNKRFCTDKCRRLFKKANRIKATEPVQTAEPVVSTTVEPTQTVEPDQTACQHCNSLYQSKPGKRFCTDKCRRLFKKANSAKKADPNTYHPTFIVPDCIWEESKTGVSATTIRELLTKLPEGAKIKDYTPEGYEHHSQPLPNPIKTEETTARAKQAIEEARRRLESKKKAADL